MRYIIHVALLFILSSCARIINKPTTRVTILTDTATKIIFNNDTLNANRIYQINPLRSKDSLRFVTITNDSTKSYAVASINSAAYYLNITSFGLYGLGFAFDHKSPKRYTYPQKIWIRNQKAYDYYHKNPDFNFENILKITPLKFIDFSFPALDISYERTLNNHSSLQISGSLITSFPTLYENQRGFSTGIEKRLFLKETAPFKRYFALEANYLKANFDYQYIFINTDIEPQRSLFGDSRSYKEIVNTRRESVTFNFKYGYQSRIGRITTDFYVGLGFRHKTTKHINRSRPNDPFGKPFLDIFNTQESNKEGKYWTLHIPANFKIGYSF